LTAFPALTGYSAIPSTGFVVVEGSKPKKSALTRDDDASYPASAIVRFKNHTTRTFGLISGTVDYEPGNFCPAAVQLSHDELSKDKSTIPGREAEYAVAKDLATSQTRHEWCRLVELTRAAWGEAGRAKLSAWVADGATQPDCPTE
jgi:hypothetical protein